jgi:hypothetical protein
MIAKQTRDIEMHMKVLALLIAAGTLFASTGALLGGTVLLPLAATMPLEGVASPHVLRTALRGLGSAAVFFAVCNLALGLSAAYGLLRRRPWGRILALVDSTISLLSFPIGTALGAYGLWVLLPQDAVDYLE